MKSTNNQAEPESIQAPQEVRIKGVFSTSMRVAVGFGHTKKKVNQNVLVYAEERDDGKISIKSLNEKFVPVGTAKVISRENLMKNYLPEPEIYMEKVYPDLRYVSRSVARGERHLRNKENYSAEMEFKKALRVDEENIRATFGLGMAYLQRGDADRGEIVFKRLVKLNGAFEAEHKHMFNEFGIHLRKNKMFTQALKYYARALEFSRKDENLYFNMARTYYEYGKSGMALKLVKKALEINADFSSAIEFKNFLEKSGRRKTASVSDKNKVITLKS
ncbi:MAG: tetratricopeptide repeat protein [Desulfonatronovibrionaceae bacterium]